MFEETGHAGPVCLKCGISRATLRKWLKRYEALGIEGRQEQSRGPKTSSSQKIFAEQEALILRLRGERSLGHRRLANELKRNHEQTYWLTSVRDKPIHQKAKFRALKFKEGCLGRVVN